MRRGKIIVCLVAVALVHAVFTMPPSEQDWYHKNASRLASIKMSSDLVSKANKWIYADGTWHCCLTGSEGVIPVGDKAGVYIVTHSAHANNLFNLPGRMFFRFVHWGGQEYVSDAILAMDRDGTFYKHDAHVCDRFNVVSYKEVRTLDDFFAAEIQAGKAWTPYTLSETTNNSQ